MVSLSPYLTAVVAITCLQFAAAELCSAQASAAPVPTTAEILHAIRNRIERVQSGSVQIRGTKELNVTGREPEQSLVTIRCVFDHNLREVRFERTESQRYADAGTSAVSPRQVETRYFRTAEISGNYLQQLQLDTPDAMPRDAAPFDPRCVGLFFKNDRFPEFSSILKNFRTEATNISDEGSGILRLEWQSKQSKRTLWLDQTRDFTPTRYEFQIPTRTNNDHTTWEPPLLTSSVTWEQKDGIWLPETCVLEQTVTTRREGGKVAVRGELYRLKFDWQSVNEPISQEVFTAEDVAGKNGVIADVRMNPPIVRVAVPPPRTITPATQPPNGFPIVLMIGFILLACTIAFVCVRRKRFSRRTLLMFITIAAVIMACAAYEIAQSRQETRIAEALSSVGATVEFQTAFYDSASPPDKQPWWRTLLGKTLGRRAKVVSMHQPSFSDLSPIAGLKHLEILDLSNTRVSDLTPIAGLKGLKRLDLVGSQVSDLTPLANLVNLESLCLHGTKVTDLTPLSALKKLERLELKGTPVRDLSPLAGLKNLKTLELQGSQVTELGPLASVENLEVLTLMDTEVRDLMPLATLKNLVTLDASQTQLRDAQFKPLQQALPKLNIIR